MKVERTSSAPSSAPAKRSTALSSSQGSNFASVLATAIGAADDAADVASATGVNAVDSIFMVQAVGDAVEGEAKRKRTFARGNAMLDALEEIRRELLFGQVSKSRLIELAQMVRARKESGIPEKLEAIINDIELRVEVELAKLTG